MAWIDDTYVANLIGKDLQRSLFATDGAYSPAMFSQHVASATAIVRAALLNSGYTPPGDSTTNETLKLAVFGQLVRSAYQRPGINLTIPDAWSVYLGLADAIVTGELRIPDLTPSDAGAVGGMEFSEADSTVAASRPQIFGRGNLGSM